MSAAFPLYPELGRRLMRLVDGFELLPERHHCAALIGLRAIHAISRAETE
jgi:hypothetical protein